MPDRAAVGRALVGYDPDQEALPEQQARERHDERGQPQARDDLALHEADRGADREAAGDRRGPAEVERRVGEDHGHGAADRTGEAERQVDLAEQQHEDLGHAEDDELGGLLEEVDQVRRGEEPRAQDLEDDDDRDQAEHDRQRAALAAANALHPGVTYSRERGVRYDLDRDPILGGELGQLLFGADRARAPRAGCVRFVGGAHQPAAWPPRRAQRAARAEGYVLDARAGGRSRSASPGRRAGRGRSTAMLSATA